MGGETKAAFCQIPNTDKWVADGASASDSVYRPGDINNALWWNMRATCESGTWHHHFSGGWPISISFLANAYTGNGAFAAGGTSWNMNYYVQSSTGAMSWSGNYYGFIETEPSVCNEYTDEWGEVHKSCTEPGGYLGQVNISGSLSCPNGFMVYVRSGWGGCDVRGG